VVTSKDFTFREVFRKQNISSVCMFEMVGFYWLPFARYYKKKRVKKE
jgi:hypothetical protein